MGTVTATTILRLKVPASSEDKSVEGWTHHGAVERVFTLLANTVKSQPGFICQHYGVQVEDDSVLVLYIDWESVEYYSKFSTSDESKSLWTSLADSIDLESSHPLTILTPFDSDTAAALEAPVTEVAFFALPDRGNDEVKKAIRSELQHVDVAVKTIGKSWGSASGWVTDVTPHAAAPDATEIALHGIYGYASVEDHMKWRETPEHAEIVKTIADFVQQAGLRPAKVYGSSMFHVNFRTSS